MKAGSRLMLGLLGQSPRDLGRRDPPPGCGRRSSRAGVRPAPVCSWPWRRCNPAASHTDTFAGASRPRRLRASSRRARIDRWPPRPRSGTSPGHNGPAPGAAAGSSMILRISRNCHSSPNPSPGIGKLTKSTPSRADKLTLGRQLRAGQLQIDDSANVMSLDRGRELVARELAASIEHASLGFVPVVPDQPALAIEHDQPRPPEARRPEGSAHGATYASGNVLDGTEARPCR